MAADVSQRLSIFQCVTPQPVDADSHAWLITSGFVLMDIILISLIFVFRSKKIKMKLN